MQPGSSLEISVSSSVTILAPANFPIGNFPSVVNAVNRVRIRISIGNFPSVVNAVNRVRIRISIGNFPSVVNAVNRVRIRISICSFVIFWSFE
jgi:hypothetical protein